jgi:hypothetical protein
VSSSYPLGWSPSLSPSLSLLVLFPRRTFGWLLQAFKVRIKALVRFPDQRFVETVFAHA